MTLASFGFKNIQHAMASVAQETVTVAKAIGNALKKVAGAEKEVEAITALVAPQAVMYERAAFQALGLLAHACDSTADASGANGINVQMDAQMIADFKALAAQIKTDLAGKGLPTA